MKIKMELKRSESFNFKLNAIVLVEEANTTGFCFLLFYENLFFA